MFNLFPIHIKVTVRSGYCYSSGNGESTLGKAECNLPFPLRYNYYERYQECMNPKLGFMHSWRYLSQISLPLMLSQIIPYTQSQAVADFSMPNGNIYHRHLFSDNDNVQGWNKVQGLLMKCVLIWK